MIIDFHTHIFPDKISSRVISVLEENTLLVEGVKSYACLDGTLSDLKRSMKENFIDYSVVLPIATTVNQSATINDFARQINAKDNIFSFGSVHPMQEDWESELERIKEMGLLGIKLHPEYQGFYIDSAESLRVLKKAQQLGLLVTIHSGFDIGIKPPLHCTPEMLANVLKIVSGDNIIAAHMGGWRMWDDVEKYLVGTPIYLDTSFVAHEISKNQIVRIIKNHTADKILHATDSPWEKQGITARYINNLSITDDQKDKILYKNAKKLLKIL